MAVVRTVPQRVGLNAILGPMKYFPLVFCRADHSITLNILDLLESQKWRADGQPYKFYNRTYIRSPSASELCQIQG